MSFAFFAAILVASCGVELDEDARTRLAHEEMRDYVMNYSPAPVPAGQVQVMDNAPRDMFGNPLEADREEDLIAEDIRLVTEYVDGGIGAPTPLPGPPPASFQPTPNYAPLPAEVMNIPTPTQRAAPATRPAPATAPARAAAPAAAPATRPARSRCPSGETWTEMRDGSFACCPPGGASCFNPCESGERATRMRDGSYACCPAGAEHCFPL